MYVCNGLICVWHIEKCRLVLCTEKNNLISLKDSVKVFIFNSKKNPVLIIGTLYCVHTTIESSLTKNVLCATNINENYQLVRNPRVSVIFFKFTKVGKGRRW